MDLHETLLQSHSVAMRDRVIRYVGNDPEKFGALARLFFSDDPVLSVRAGWPMGYIVEKYPALLSPWIKQVVTILENPAADEAALRHSVRMLQHAPIPKRYHGRIMNACFNFVADIQAAAAVKAFSLTVLHHLSEAYPDIRAELKMIIRERWEEESPAFRSRGKKILKALDK